MKNHHQLYPVGSLLRGIWSGSYYLVISVSDLECKAMKIGFIHNGRIEKIQDFRSKMADIIFLPPEASSTLQMVPSLKKSSPTVSKS